MAAKYRHPRLQRFSSMGQLLPHLPTKVCLHHPPHRTSLTLSQGTCLSYVYMHYRYRQIYCTRMQPCQYFRLRRQAQPLIPGRSRPNSCLRYTRLGPFQSRQNVNVTSSKKQRSQRGKPRERVEKALQLQQLAEPSHNAHTRTASQSRLTRKLPRSWSPGHRPRMGHCHGRRPDSCLDHLALHLTLDHSAGRTQQRHRVGARIYRG